MCHTGGVPPFEAFIGLGSAVFMTVIKLLCSCPVFLHYETWICSAAAHQTFVLHIMDCCDNTEECMQWISHAFLQKNAKIKR